MFLASQADRLSMDKVFPWKTRKFPHIVNGKRRSQAFKIQHLN